MAAASSKVPLVSSVFRSGLFQDKAAIVTGGGTGIGRAIAQELLHLGTILPSSCACTGTVSAEISPKSKIMDAQNQSQTGSSSIDPSSSCHVNSLFQMTP